MPDDNNNNNAPAETIDLLTPELVRQVADHVYQLWQRDLQTDHERSRLRRSNLSQRQRAGR